MVRSSQSYWYFFIISIVVEFISCDFSAELYEWLAGFIRCCVQVEKRLASGVIYYIPLYLTEDISVRQHSRYIAPQKNVMLHFVGFRM